MLQITALYAGINALILVALAALVIIYRRKNRISLFTEGDKRMAELMRGHGNAAEYMAIFLVCLGTLEASGASTALLHCCGLLFTAGRVAHGFHFAAARTDFLFRVGGMIMTLTALMIAAIRAILIGIGY